jgi:hypothetical protein
MINSGFSSTLIEGFFFLSEEGSYLTTPRLYWKDYEYFNLKLDQSAFHDVELFEAIVLEGENWRIKPKFFIPVIHDGTNILINGPKTEINYPQTKFVCPESFREVIENFSIISRKFFCCIYAR